MPSEVMLCVTSYWVLSVAEIDSFEGSFAAFFNCIKSGKGENHLKATRHNGRSGKNGTYNPKHNDRQFDVGNSSHIDGIRAMSNVYWDCLQGLHDTEDPDKKPGKNNNRKIVFDKICRDLLLEICEKHKLQVDKDPVYGGREYLEKQDYILKKQKERLRETEAALNEATIKLSDVDALIEEITDAAYDKACDLVSETVQATAHEEDLRIIEDYKSEVEEDRKVPTLTKGYINLALERVMKKIIAAASKVLFAIQERLKEPGILEKNKGEIRTAAKDSVREKILKYQEQQERKAVNEGKKKENKQER